MSFFEKLKKGLQKTKNAIFKPFTSLFKSLKRVDEDLIEELEEILVCADVGAQTTEEILDQLRAEIKENKIKDTEDVKNALKRIMRDMVGEGEEIIFGDGITVILVIGVNGVGKTTSIGKIASSLKRQKKKVVVAAADTFRAAAIDQLAVWTDRAGVELIKHSEGSDPAAVVFDAISSAKAKGADVLLIDTAGRLHNKVNLMEELKKIGKVVSKEWPEAEYHKLIVIDGTTGQNSKEQVRLFDEAVGLSDLCVTKLDGTSKGGFVIELARTYDIAMRYIGVGETPEDLLDFDADEFVDAIFE